MSSESPAPIPHARLLVGILLHFCVPAYLLACLAAALLGRPPVAIWSEVPARMLWTAAWFLPAFLVLTAVAAGAGALLDRRRPGGADELARSRRRFGAARARLLALADPSLLRALDRLTAARPDHGDPRCRRVVADLDAASHSFATAFASALPERRPPIVALATQTIDRLALALEDIAAERGRLDEGDARTVAGYLHARYGNEG